MAWAPDEDEKEATASNLAVPMASAAAGPYRVPMGTASTPEVAMASASAGPQTQFGTSTGAGLHQGASKTRFANLDRFLNANGATADRMYSQALTGATNGLDAASKGVNSAEAKFVADSQKNELSAPNAADIQKANMLPTPPITYTAANGTMYGTNHGNYSDNGYAAASAARQEAANAAGQRMEQGYRGPSDSDIASEYAKYKEALTGTRGLAEAGARGDYQAAMGPGANAFDAALVGGVDRGGFKAAQDRFGAFDKLYTDSLAASREAARHANATYGDGWEGNMDDWQALYDAANAPIPDALNPNSAQNLAAKQRAQDAAVMQQPTENARKSAATKNLPDGAPQKAYGWGPHSHPVAAEAQAQAHGLTLEEWIAAGKPNLANATAEQVERWKADYRNTHP